MTNYSELMTVLDEGDNMTLYLLDNDVFGPTAVIVTDEGKAGEQAYVLTDMQGPYPKTIDEIADYDWCRAEDVDF